MPLINVLGGVPNELPVLFEIKDRTEHTQEGSKKITGFRLRLRSSYGDLEKFPLNLNKIELPETPENYTPEFLVPLRNSGIPGIPVFRLSETQKKYYPTSSRIRVFKVFLRQTKANLKKDTVGCLAW